MDPSFSFFQNAWRRLTKNKGAVTGLIIIFIAVVTGIFAYFLGADPTPNSDRQVVEIMAGKPGFTQLFLRVKKKKEIPPTGFFERLLFGEEDRYFYVPINSYRESGDSITVEKFIDEVLRIK